jgi:hypothetical protein
MNQQPTFGASGVDCDRGKEGLAMTARTVRGVLYAALLATSAVAAAPVAQAEPSSDANTALSGIARSSRERRWLR